ncbi:MAG: hypothetical protein LBE38_07810 [Deltaproteobacteria bacterium]|jgi:flagellar hook-basal body complex protein FliE|nr:hypothetical protein [Deltaproteobacteria bacterium]
MKILTFNPMDPTPNKASPSSKKNQPQGASSFKEALDLSMNARDRVSQENLRANKAANNTDLKEASGLLATLIEQMHAAGPESLQKTHNLEGILYYF